MRKTKYAKHALAHKGTRAICQDCGGFGSGCLVCGERGTVCPRCQGARFLRTGRHGNAFPEKGQLQSAIVRCDACCEGNQVNPAKEAKAISDYLIDIDGREWQWRRAIADAYLADCLKGLAWSRQTRKQP